MCGRRNYIIILFLSAFLVFSCKDNDDHAEHIAEADLYTCPMHPEILRKAPGTCPVCGMDLVKKEKGSVAPQDIELETLLQPANAFVISTVPLTAIERRIEKMELKVVGVVAYDTRQVGAISSRVGGRIERLYIRYQYQPVKKGQRIMDLYSPELVTAQQNLLFLLNNDPSNISLINAAKTRLGLLGLSPQQIAAVVSKRVVKYSIPIFSNYSGFVADIPTSNADDFNDMNDKGGCTNEVQIKEGMYIKTGQAVFTVYDPRKAWILLEVFPEQQGLIQQGDAVRIIPETSPGNDFRATINYVEPVFRRGSKTLSARVYFNNASMKLPIGSRVTANIFAKAKEYLWLPKEAVLSTGRNKIVFLKEKGGFRAHGISTGVEINNSVQVVEGLRQTDSVASIAQFLVDNETFIKVKKWEK